MLTDCSTMPEDITGNDTDLSVRNVKSIAHSATNNGRVSKDAAIRVAYEEQQRIGEIFRLAEILAEKEGRKTVKEEDIRTVRQLLDAELPK